MLNHPADPKAGPPELIHGDEVIEPVDAAVEAPEIMAIWQCTLSRAMAVWQAAIQKLKERADKHAEEHVAQAGALYHL